MHLVGLIELAMMYYFHSSIYRYRLISIDIDISNQEYQIWLDVTSVLCVLLFQSGSVKAVRW